MTVVFEPGRLSWPLGWPRAQHRTRSNFSQNRSYHASAKFIDEEVRRLGGTRLVVTSNLAVNKDGSIRASQRNPDDSGVAIYFQLRNDPVVFACDQYVRAEDNLYAIAKTIEAKRAILRWGCATGTREFTGYAALPASTEPQRPGLYEVLGFRDRVQVDPGEIRTAWRAWVLENHPDRGGSHDEFVRVKALYEAYMAYKGAIPA